MVHLHRLHGRPSRLGLPAAVLHLVHLPGRPPVTIDTQVPLAAISGVAVMSDGAPVAGATASLADGYQVGTATTDANGHFEFTGLESEPMNLSAIGEVDGSSVIFPPGLRRSHDRGDHQRNLGDKLLTGGEAGNIRFVPHFDVLVTQADHVNVGTGSAVSTPSRAFLVGASVTPSP